MAEDFKKIHVSLLNKAQLNWAAAKAKGRCVEVYYSKDNQPLDRDDFPHGIHKWDPTNNPLMGYPIISELLQEHQFSFHFVQGGNGATGNVAAKYQQNNLILFGEDLLVAAVRAFVATKLGVNVDIPVNVI